MPSGPAEPSGGSESSEVASQVGEAAALLGARMGDPGVPHTIEEVAAVTEAFSTAVEGLSDGINGITEWLRAAGHAGPLSGQASAVADRLGHAGREVHRLAEAIEQADQQAS